MQEPIDPDVAEKVNITYSDEYAAKRRWEDHPYLTDPLGELQVFFDHLPGNIMLDVGCGWGRYVHRFLEKGLQYCGIDHSPEMVSAAQADNPGEEFKVMSYRKIDVPDSSFDALWCCCTFSGEPKHNMPNVLVELRRVLKSDGVIMIVQPAVSESGEDWIENDAGRVLYHADYDLSELEAMLHASGFTTIKTNHNHTQGAMSLLMRKEVT